MAQTIKMPKLKIVTNEIRVTFPHITTPNPKLSNANGSKYTLCALVPKTDKDGVAKLQNFIAQIMEQNKLLWGGSVPTDLTIPLRDGDIERKQYPEFAGHYFFNTGSKYRPVVYDLERNAIQDPTQIYPGMFARLHLMGFAYSYSGNNGVSFGLESLQKTRDGEPLRGRSDPASVFADESEDILA